MKNFGTNIRKFFHITSYMWRILAYFNNNILSPNFSKAIIALISGTSPDIFRTFPIPKRLCSIRSPTRKLDIGSGVNSESGTLGGNGLFSRASRLVGRGIPTGLTEPRSFREAIGPRSFRAGAPPLSFRPSEARGEISRPPPNLPNRNPGWSSSSTGLSTWKSSFRRGFCRYCGAISRRNRLGALLSCLPLRIRVCAKVSATAVLARVRAT